MKLYRGPVAWRSVKQYTVTISSTEAELLALTNTGKKAIAIIRLFAGIRFDLNNIIIIGYNNL